MAKITKKSDVPRELERAGELCLAFANTAAPRIDRRSNPRSRARSPSPPVFADYGELVDWSRRMGCLEDVHVRRMRQAAEQRPEDAKAVVAQALALRRNLVRLFTAVAAGKPIDSADLELLNEILGLSVRRLVVRGEDFELGWGGDEGALGRMLWPVVSSASDLLRRKLEALWDWDQSPSSAVTQPVKPDDAD